MLSWPFVTTNAATMTRQMHTTVTKRSIFACVSLLESRPSVMNAREKEVATWRATTT